MKTQFSTTIQATTWTRLNDMCYKEKLAKSHVTDMALKHILKEYEEHGIQPKPDNEVSASTS